MKAWSELSAQGRTRRLRNLAIQALTQYDLPVNKVRLIEVATNTLFRVDCTDGKKYALRVCTPGEHSFHDAQVEMRWLEVLNEKTTLPVPKAVANRDGKLITYCQIDSVPEERRCVLFEWIPGKAIAERLSPEIYHKLGILMAQMHRFAAGYFDSGASALDSWPEDMRPMRWDKVFYYPEEPIVLYEDTYQKYFTKERLTLIEAAQADVEPYLASLYQKPSEAMIIHGDLHFWNVHVWRGQLFPLDFEDLMWGYPIQDVAITLWYGQEREDYGDLRAAFQAGYSDIRPWPGMGEEIDGLILARTLMFINYAAHVLTEPEEYIERQCEKLKQWLMNR
ncbi:MAG: phosphotransferase [Chloroflexota bacterium]